MVILVWVSARMIVTSLSYWIHFEWSGSLALSESTVSWAALLIKFSLFQGRHPCDVRWAFDLSIESGLICIFRLEQLVYSEIEQAFLLAWVESYSIFCFDILSFGSLRRLTLIHSLSLLGRELPGRADNHAIEVDGLQSSDRLSGQIAVVFTEWVLQTHV